MEEPDFSFFASEEAVEEQPAVEESSPPIQGSFPAQEAKSSDTEYEKDTHVYKKWFRSSKASGFLTLDVWLDGGKASLDIGSLKDGGLDSSTLCWVDLVEYAAYLRAISSGNGARIYPANSRDGLPTDESFAAFGGGIMDGEPVSRIIKIHHWPKGKDQFDVSAFIFKCGHFKARVAQSGAIIPDMQSPLSTDSIKISRREVAVMSYRLDLVLNGFAAKATKNVMNKNLNGSRS